MIDLHSARVLYLGRFAVIVRAALLIQLGDLLRSSAAEDLARVESGQFALSYDLDRTEGISAQLVEIIIDTELLKLEHFCHSVAEFFLNFVLRSNVIGLEIGRVGLRQRLSIHLSVRFKGNLIYLHIISGDHIVRQAVRKLFAHLVGIHLNIV